MLQYIVFALFFMAGVAWVFALGLQSAPMPQRPQSLTKMAMDGVGLTEFDSYNKRQVHQLTVQLSQNRKKLKEQMNFVEEKHQKLRMFIDDQQNLVAVQGRNLKDMSQQMNRDVRLRADFMRMKDTMASLENKNRMLVAQGQDLKNLNERIRQNARQIRDRIDTMQVNSRDLKDAMESRMMALMDQTQTLEDRQKDLVEKVREQSLRTQEHADFMKNRLETMRLAAQDRSRILRDKMDQLISKQESLRQKIDDNKLQMDLLSYQIQDRMRMQKDRLRDLREQSADHQRLMKERVADQMQRIKDQTGR